MPPLITGVTPAKGPRLTATAVVISGTGFKDPPIDITFRGVAATSQQFVSGAELRCVTPALAAGLADVGVTQSDGSAILSDGWEYEVATVKSAQYTSETATPVVLNDQRQWGGTVHVKHATYTTAGESANDVIQMVSVKSGDIIHEIIVAWSALPTGSTFDVGDGGDVDRFIDGCVGTTAGIERLGGGGVPGGGTMVAAPVSAVGYQYTADDTIDVILLGHSGTTTSATIELIVFYTSMGA